MLLDHAIICFVTIPPAILLMHGSLAPQTDLTTNPMSAYAFIPLFAVYFCKDCVGGRSVAKRMLKLQVADYKKGTVASPFQSLIRNFFDVLWPAEIIVTFFNPQRRIGNRVAGTKIISYTPNVNQEKTKIWQVVLCLGIAAGASYLLMQLLQPK